MNEKILKAKDVVLKFYKEHREYVNYALISIACLFLGKMKGRSDAIDQLSEITFTFRVNDDVRERFSS